MSEVQQQLLKADQPQKVEYCIPLWLRDEQIKAAIKRVSGRIQPGEPQIDPVAVVCFGPSLIDTWEKIKEFKYIISCSGSHKFLVERGIIPTWHIEVDPRAHKVALIGQPQKETEYLIASACHKAVFDHLEGYNVKLWHVFDSTESGARILPNGEWAITGGCGVGLRAMTIAAFLGFYDLQVFGMDGSEGRDGNKHAAEHPNEPSGHNLVEYPEGSGTFYKTTPSLLEAARTTFHELNQMPKVRATFHGDGLVQAMAKDYKPKPVADILSNAVAFQKPELISEDFCELNAKLHRDNPTYGAGGAKHTATVLALAKSINTTSVLDYGCGKGLLAASLPFPIWEYDPAIPGKDATPRAADLVVCTDVLEHIEPEKINYVIGDLRRCVIKGGYFVIHLGPAQKTYADGRNTHLIQESPKWWETRLAEHFKIGKTYTIGHELHVIVGPKDGQPAPLMVKPFNKPKLKRKKK